MKLRWDRLLRRNKRDYCEVFGSETGKRVLRDIISESGFFVDPVMRGDPKYALYWIGRHWIVRHIKYVMGMTEEQLDEHTQQAESQEAEDRERGV